MRPEREEHRKFDSNIFCYLTIILERLHNITDRDIQGSENWNIRLCISMTQLDNHRICKILNSAIKRLAKKFDGSIKGSLIHHTSPEEVLPEQKRILQAPTSSETVYGIIRRFRRFLAGSHI